ncbi:Death on curing protein [Moorella glycerini]|uniref:Toxin Doc n=1 Tax=Neomoorella stamsii TaxID=1266720 RepID=A0A9X7J0A3_9FIRM|nr:MULTISPECIES: type II toxin-antitoxin system death-on-curing family toxin [Moorella]PRR69991.1 Toxin Doc [Moorella stamsii]CEP68458.1 Death on curing protein [Moorella glycerini]
MIYYPDLDITLKIYRKVINETGGSYGIRDLGLLEAALARPRATFDGNDLYPTLFAKAAVLAESIAKNHPFIDGNKRMAVVLASIFLERNGYRCSAMQKEWVKFGVELAESKLDLNKIIQWFHLHCQPL